MTSARDLESSIQTVLFCPNIVHYGPFNRLRQLSHYTAQIANRGHQMDQVKMTIERARLNFKWVAAHFCVITLAASLAIAQRTTGSLGGQVLDPQGATVSNAKISVTDQETGVVSSTVTSSAGMWKVPSLIPGKYSVSIQALGFRMLVRRDIFVLADHENTADAQLQVGVASEVLEVLGS